MTLAGSILCAACESATQPQTGVYLCTLDYAGDTGAPRSEEGYVIDMADEDYNIRFPSDWVVQGCQLDWPVLSCWGTHSRSLQGLYGGTQGVWTWDETTSTIAVFSDPTHFSGRQYVAGTGNYYYDDYYDDWPGGGIEQIDFTAEWLRDE